MDVSKRFENYYSALIPSVCPYDFRDKDRSIANQIAYMLNRTQSMFRWDGLPKTIPARILELYLQLNGNACFYRVNDDLYVFVGGRGGKPDVYYMPTEYIIANPALNLSVSLKIGEECVVMPNDAMYIGLYPLLSRYITAMAETELSIDIATVNSRIISLISAKDDRMKESAVKYLEDMRDGKPGIIAGNAFLGEISAQPYGTTGNTNTITNLIELMQYQKASMFNELGLNANYNMKRESLNSTESQLNNDALLPLIDNMLECRQTYAEKVNEMFGTDIHVSLASSWEDNQDELDAEQENLESMSDQEQDVTEPEETQDASDPSEQEEDEEQKETE